MDWIDEFIEDLDKFEYNIDRLLDLIHSSTFDHDTQRQLEAEAWELKSEAELEQMVTTLYDNQLSPLDAPGRRMGAADIHRQLKKQGL